ncbi:MAG TPA: VOC family protein [Pyrinomonadaceae bacterium]|nr:VOC family protein [Pyrinomonadaceae bacterium]
MAEFNIPKHGQICWRELATKDLPAAKEFYRQMFGWTMERSKVSPVIEYQEIHVGNAAVGGMMAIDASWGDPPPPSHWSTYIAVDNADETVAKITANGGSIRVPAFDAPGVGRIAIAVEPGGAGFAIIQFAQAG